jgi:hypothetical protein
MVSERLTSQEFGEAVSCILGSFIQHHSKLEQIIV